MAGSRDELNAYARPYAHPLACAAAPDVAAPEDVAPDAVPVLDAAPGAERHAAVLPDAGSRAAPVRLPPRAASEPLLQCAAERRPALRRAVPRPHVATRAARAHLPVHAAAEHRPRPAARHALPVEHARPLRLADAAHRSRALR